MATVTGLTAARMREIEAASIVNGAVDLSTGVLKLERRDGGIVIAGNVRGLGVAPGGTPGQALFKTSSADYETEWRAVPPPARFLNGPPQATYINGEDATVSDSGATILINAASNRIAGLYDGELGWVWYRGTLEMGTVPGNRVDLLFNDPTNNISILRSAPNTNTSGGVVFVSPNEMGFLVDNSWRWRVNSAGRLTHGTVDGGAIVGGGGSIDPFVVPGYMRDPANGTSWWTSNRGGGWGFGTRMIFRDYAVANDWHFGFWNANGDEEMLVGHDGGRYVRHSAIYARTTTNPANVAVGAWGELYRVTSARDSKLVIEDAPETWAESFWNLRPRTWFDRDATERYADALAEDVPRDLDSEPDPVLGPTRDISAVMASPLVRIPGFVAEEVEEAGLDIFVTRDASGQIEGLAYDRMLAAAVVAMKEERAKRIAAEERLDILEQRLLALEGLLNQTEE